MPANAAIPYFKAGQDVTGTATAALTGKRFVAIAAGGRPGAPAIAAATAAKKPFGVLGHDIAEGGHVHVLRGGIVPVTAGGDLVAGAEVEVGADGKAVTKTSGVAVGTVIANAATGADAAIALSL